MNTAQIIGQTLKLARVAARLKQQDLAKELGVRPNYLSLIEQGHREPSIKLLRRCAKKLNMPLGHYLFLALREVESE